MVQLLLWMIIAYGLSNIVVYGSIFNGPREFIRKWSESTLPFNSFGTFNGVTKRDEEFPIPEDVKDLIRKDNELHYLIGALGYQYKEI